MVGIVKMIVNVIFYVIEFILFLRFILVLFGANLSGAFSKWVFASSASLFAPFKNIFPSMDIVGFKVDFSLLFALIVYVIVGQLIIRVLAYVEH
jgi:hypothetical protein